MTTAEQAAVLRKPFPREVIGQLPRIWCNQCSEANKNRRGTTCEKHTKVKCRVCNNNITEAHLHLDYVGHAETTDRLLSADPDWTWEPMAFGDDGLPKFDTFGGLWIKLTVCGTTRPGYGDAQGKKGADAIKEAIGDAPAGRYALMPTFTFAAAAHAALWCGLTPLLCDIHPRTWAADPADESEMLRRYADSIAIVMPYATFGYPIDVERYKRLSGETGVPVVMQNALAATRLGGAVGYVGVQTGDLVLDGIALVGKQVTGILEGSADPHTFIPRMIQLWQDGQFPFDRLIEEFPLSAINEAEEASLSGKVIKPVLRP